MKTQTDPGRFITLPNADVQLPLPASAPNTSFRGVLKHAQATPTLEALPAAPTRVTVQPGDTLTGMVKSQMAQQGSTVNAHSAYRMALQVAQKNSLATPDRIYPGQSVDFSTLAHATPSREPQPLPTQARLQSHSAAQGHPILEKTLQRAVDKGFIPADERATIYGRIVELSKRYHFAPDDFARVALMESDGLNPRATNGRCHGIIQFCEGINQGAASVGYAGRAATIRKLDVMAQLDLVERYFKDVGGTQKRAHLSLDDLYLIVLSPAAARERNRRTPLQIAGNQALQLHVGQNRYRPITRESIVGGLIHNTIARLGLSPFRPSTHTAATERQHIAALGPDTGSKAANARLAADTQKPTPTQSPRQTQAGEMGASTGRPAKSHLESGTPLAL